MIVTDVHSGEAAAKAAEDWARQFQKDEVPEDVETITIPLLDVMASSERIDPHGRMEEILEHGIRVKLDKLLPRAGLADSVSDAVRKIRQKAVKVDGELKTDPVIFWSAKKEMTVRVGRKIKRVVLATQV